MSEPENGRSKSGRSKSGGHLVPRVWHQFNRLAFVVVAVLPMPHVHHALGDIKDGSGRPRVVKAAALLSLCDRFL